MFNNLVGAVVVCRLGYGKYFESTTTVAAADMGRSGTRLAAHLRSQNDGTKTIYSVVYVSGRRLHFLIGYS
jgi:hypothetical protein